jgi:predicted Zn-dependent protease with MMP-like domain
VPDIDAFQAMAEASFAALPAEFRELCGDVVVRVQDFADRETLDAMDIDSPYGLLGLYHGVSLDRRSVLDVPMGPDMVFLYRKPILLYAREEGDSVRDVVTHVLVHEIGHHFGLSDEDMEQIEQSA